MMCMKRTVSVGIAYIAACALLTVVLGIVLLRYNKLKNDALQRIHAIQLSRKDLIFSAEGLRKYFYEPKPDTTQSDEQDWLSYVPTYTINSDALNERHNYLPQKEEGVFRIITIGDSFTFGAFVNTADNYTERLEDLLNNQKCNAADRFEVINLGVNGYDLSYIVERFRTRGVKYNPDLVIWLVNGHNVYQVNDLIKERERAIEAALDPEVLKRFEQKGRYYVAAEKARREFIKHYGKTNVLAMQEEFLNEFSALYDGPMLFAFFTQGADEDIDALLAGYAVKRNAKTYIFKGIPDLHEVNGILPDGHPSVYGHNVIAGNVFAYLMAGNLYPCH